MEVDVEQKVVNIFYDHKIMNNGLSSDVPISDSNLEVPESAAAGFNATDEYTAVQHYALIAGVCIYMSVTVRK